MALSLKSIDNTIRFTLSGLGTYLRGCWTFQCEFSCLPLERENEYTVSYNLNYKFNYTII